MSKHNLRKRVASAKPGSGIAIPADCPLWKNPNGQWCKKVKGKVWYFGTDLTAALERWNVEGPDILAGRKPRARRDDSAISILQLVNRFLTSKKLQRDAGELSPRMFGEYYGVCETILSAFGKARQVDDLKGDDFEQLRKRFVGLAPVTVSKRVQIVRTVFVYAFAEELISRPVNFGTSFQRPSKKTMRLARKASGSKLIDAEHLRRILDRAKQPMRAMVLLALNCGLGNTDIAALPRYALDLEGGWLDYPRPKTGIDRRCPLWPDTVAAIREALDKRPAPKNPHDDRLVFITRTGKPWIRITPRDDGEARVFDAVTLEFRKLLFAVGAKRDRVGFYALRHTFRTVADGSKDQVACDAIMGHAPAGDDMASKYRERISDDRLRAVVDTVHSWLWPAETGPATIPFTAANAG
jgi:integrase